MARIERDQHEVKPLSRFACMLPLRMLKGGALIVAMLDPHGKDDPDPDIGKRSYCDGMAFALSSLALILVPGPRFTLRGLPSKLMKRIAQGFDAPQAAMCFGVHPALGYFQHIDRGLHTLLKEETAPLVLADVAYLFPIYQKVNTYPHLLEQGIAGNPDKLKADTLREEAWALVEPVVLQVQQEAAAHYRELAGSGRASSKSSEIVPAAYHGRVASLFVALDRELWGRFDPAADRLQIHEQAELGDEDLLNQVASQTLLHGGAVYAVEQAQIPAEASLAAVFRYASPE